jgi:hypothetical protein
MDVKIRQELFNQLKAYPGWITRLKEKTKHLKEDGFHRNHYYNVLGGHRPDHYGIITIAADLLLELKKEQQKEQKKNQRNVEKKLKQAKALDA